MRRFRDVRVRTADSHSWLDISGNSTLGLTRYTPQRITSSRRLQLGDPHQRVFCTEKHSRIQKSRERPLKAVPVGVSDQNWLKCSGPDGLGSKGDFTSSLSVREG